MLMARITRKQRKRRLILKRIRALAILALLFVLFLGLFLKCNKNKEVAAPKPVSSPSAKPTSYAHDFNQVAHTFENAYPRPDSCQVTAFKTALLEDPFAVKKAQDPETFVSAMDQTLALLEDADAYLVQMKTFADLREYYQAHAKGSIYDTLFQSEEAQKAYPGASRRSEQRELVLDILVDKQFAYIKLPNLYAPRPKDAEKIATFLNNVKDYTFIVFDLRDCTGLNQAYWMDHLVAPLIIQPLEMKQTMLVRQGEPLEYYRLIQKQKNGHLTLSEPQKMDDQAGFYKVTASLQIAPKNSLVFYGALFILQDANTRGAAADFAAFAQATGFAKLVGRPCPVGSFGLDPYMVQLESSGMILSLPLAQVVDENAKAIRFIQPDVLLDAQTDALNKLIEIVQIEPKI